LAKFNSLNAWLDWQATLNPSEIDLGLERVADVLARMGLPDQFDCPLIIVAGTNGKGSVVSLLEAIARAAGLKVCCYTSPHILSYNERIRIDGEMIDDQGLCRSFERIDQARGDVALTYFEFGTLAAIDLFRRAEPDLVIMEIGLGGRLDAVNVMQPDVSVITSVAIDHTDWLGDNREAIAREKAGVMRPHKPTIYGEQDVPASLLAVAEQKSAELYLFGQRYNIEELPSSGEWSLHSPFGDIESLPVPALKGEFQKTNAATAIMALQALADRVNIAYAHIRAGLERVYLPGRYEQLHDQPRVITDVAHNPHAVASLVTQLQAEPVEGETRIVIAMLADKPVEEVITLLLPLADSWYCAGLESESRGLAMQGISEKIARLAQVAAGVKLCAKPTVKAAIEAAMGDAKVQDRIVIMGSFHTVSAAKQYFS